MPSLREAAAGASAAMALAFGLGSAGAEKPVDLDEAKSVNYLIAYLETLEGRARVTIMTRLVLKMHEALADPRPSVIGTSKGVSHVYCQH